MLLLLRASWLQLNCLARHSTARTARQLRRRCRLIQPAVAVNVDEAVAKRALLRRMADGCKACVLAALLPPRVHQQGGGG